MNMSTWNEGINSDPTSEICCLVNFDQALETRYLPCCTHKSAKNDLLVSTQMSQLKIQSFSHSHHGSTVILYIHPPLPRAGQAQPPHYYYTTEGSNLPPPHLGPVLIRKYEQWPGVILVCHFPPFLYKETFQWVELQS